MNQSIDILGGPLTAGLTFLVQVMVGVSDELVAHLSTTSSPASTFRLSETLLPPLVTRGYRKSESEEIEAGVRRRDGPLMKRGGGET